MKFWNQMRMSEGRKAQVMLPDDRRLEILVQPKLLSGELLDIVSSHFNLKEKEYFGLSYKDDTNHYHWLQLDRRVLEHDYPKKPGLLTLNFAVRFFIESIGFLRDSATVELFYLQAKQSIFRGDLECDSQRAFELAAHALQASCGDFIDDDSAKRQLKKLPLLPTSALQDHPSISYCEEQVIAHYRKLEGQSRGSSVVNYQALVEELPTYGIHYYEVKDKAGMPWWLGLSHKGISQFDHNDKRVPRRSFAWKQLENLYFRDKKFSIEVHDPKRVSVSRRTFGPGGVNVHAWFASSPTLTKCIWSMAVSQHQFYLDRKQSKSSLPLARSMTDIAADLCQSTSSLPSSASGDISRSNSAQSLTNSLTGGAKIELSGDELESSWEAQREMYTALKARRDVLEEALRRKTEELRHLCLSEAEYTGALPPEIPLVPGEPVPQVRKRVGAEFSLSPKFINRDHATEASELLAKSELEFELQGKIAKAAWKLYQDPAVSKQVRKQRRQSYHRAHQKLKELEKKFHEVRGGSKPPLRTQSSIEDADIISPMSSPAIHRSHLANNIGPGQVKIITSPRVEVVEMSYSESPNMRRMASSPANMTSPPSSVADSPSVRRISSTPSSMASSQQGSRPGSPLSMQRSLGRTNTPSPNPQRQYMGGYTPNAVYQTRTQYRNQMYPTFSMRSQSQSSNQSEYDNVSGGYASRPRVEEDGCPNRETVHVHNLYNVNTTQTMRYDSADELKTPEDNEDRSYSESSHSERLRLPSKHGSLDGAYNKRRAPGSLELSRYGSLEGQLSDNSGQEADLAPDKYGIKMDSEYNDSVAPLSEGMAHLGRDSESDSMSQSGSSTHEYPRAAYREQAYSAGQTETGGRYQSYESYSNVTSGTPQWYECDSPSVARQQPPPHTPQYEVPTQTFVQEQAAYTREAVTIPQQQMTVTKYQSYVEVSKPFEMSDYYKYSEKLRKQRTIEKRQQKLECVLSGSVDSYMNSSVSSPNMYAYTSADSTRSPASLNSTASPYACDTHSNPTSPYSYSQHFQDSFYTNTPPSPGSHQSRSRLPQRAQPPMNYGGVGARPYQPPQPMSCEPVNESPSTPHSYHYPEEHMTPKELSSFDATESQATAFSEEMLAWYEDHEQTKTSTLV